MAGSVTSQRRLVLPNGLTILATSARAAPVFTAMLVVEAGSRYDRDERAGLAALSGAALLEGSTARSAASISTRWLGSDNLVQPFNNLS